MIDEKGFGEASKKENIEKALVEDVKNHLGALKTMHQGFLEKGLSPNREIMELKLDEVGPEEAKFWDRARKAENIDEVDSVRNDFFVYDKKHARDAKDKGRLDEIKNASFISFMNRYLSTLYGLYQGVASQTVPEERIKTFKETLLSKEPVPIESVEFSEEKFETSEPAELKIDVGFLKPEEKKMWENAKCIKDLRSLINFSREEWNPHVQEKIKSGKKDNTPFENFLMRYLDKIGELFRDGASKQEIEQFKKEIEN